MELDNNPSAPDRKKLRLSCDNCYSAKVKCAKERPACSRCVNLDTTCVYSQSRRAGKPKGSRNGQSGPSSVASSPPPPSDFGLFAPGRQQSWSLDQPGDNGFSGRSIPRSGTTSSNASLGENSGHGFGELISSAPAKSLNLTTSLDSIFEQSAYNEGNLSTGDTVFPEFNGELFGMMPGPMPDFMAGMTPTCNPLSTFTDDPSSFLAVNDMQSLDLPPNANFDDSTAGISNNACHCSTALQETLGMLNNPPLSFDRLLAVNKTAVNRVSLHLSCQCPPDFSSIMLLFVIITRIVHWYKKCRNGQGSEEVAVTLGTFKMDKEDEYRMKIVLIKSELRKVEMLIGRSRERFERSLDGQDKQFYEANMAFLEQRLQDTVRGL